MIDLKWVRQYPEALDASLKKRGAPPQSAQLLTLDRAHRDCLQEVEELRAARKVCAQKMGRLKASGGEDPELTQEGGRLKQALERVEKDLHTHADALKELVDRLPNILAEDVPEGADENDNVCVETWGDKPTFSFAPQAQDTLGEPLGMNMRAGAALSGSRFVVLEKGLARLERALSHFMLDQHIQNGFEEVSPPYLVRTEAVYGAGQLPKFEGDLFKTTDGHWLIPTAEVALANLVREQILGHDSLPRRYVAYTPCFRSEAGAAGRDTRGIIRLHQFSKVELFSVTTPETSVDEHEHLRKSSEHILQLLKLPYRRVILCGGDTGFAAQKTYDLEVWLPHQKTYREIASISRCGDFQARRMGARVRDPEGKTHFVHMLNGSGLPIGRTIAAILENYQNEDGSVRIPEVLQRYMNEEELRP